MLRPYAITWQPVQAKHALLNSLQIIFVWKGICIDALILFYKVLYTFVTHSKTDSTYEKTIENRAIRDDLHPISYIVRKDMDLPLRGKDRGWY